jgi:hypothetical protein
VIGMIIYVIGLTRQLLGLCLWFCMSYITRAKDDYRRQYYLD